MAAQAEELVPQERDLAQGLMQGRVPLWLAQEAA